jgi:hypothetical protein
MLSWDEDNDKAPYDERTEHYLQEILWVRSLINNNFLINSNFNTNGNELSVGSNHTLMTCILLLKGAITILHQYVVSEELGINKLLDVMSHFIACSSFLPIKLWPGILNRWTLLVPLFIGLCWGIAYADEGSSEW